MIETVTFHWPPGHPHWLIHETASAAAWSFQPHRHDGFGDLTLVCDGQVTNSVNGHSTVLTSGSVSWTRERDVHEMQGRHFRFLNINVSDDQLALLAMAVGRESEFKRLQKQKTTPFALLGRRATQVEAEWTRLFRMRRGPAADLLANQLALGVLVELLAPLLPGADRDRDLPAWLLRGIRHIDRCIEDGVTVSELADVCGRSAEHVSRSFSKHLGMSPSAWINQQRITRAALLLSSTNREILDICYSVGFQSASYFYRLFRREHGMPPHQYRAKHHPMWQ